MLTTWAQILPAAGVGLALLIAPGALIGRCLRLPLQFAAAMAPVFSALTITSSAWLAWFAGQRWQLGWVLGTALLLGALIAGLFWLAGRLGLTELRLLYRHRPQPWRVSALALGQYLIGIGVMACAMVPRYLGALNAPDNFLQRFDNAFHLNAVRWIANTGQAASPALGWMVNSDGYPLGWHQFNALTLQLAGGELTGTVYACFLVTIFVAWPLSLSALLESVLRPTALARMALGPLALSFMSFPHMTLEGGGLYANLFGLALAPAAMAAMVQLAQVGERIQLGAWQALVVGLLALLGTASAHPNATMLVAAASLPALGWSAWLMYRRPEPTQRLRLLPRWLWIGGVLAATGLLAVAWEVLAPGLEVAPWPAFESIAQSIGEIAVGTTMGKQAVWTGTFLFIAGVVVVVRRRRRLLWVIGCHLVIAGLYLVSSAFGAGRLRNMITGVFFNDTRRTGSALGILLVVFAGLAIDELWRALRCWVRRNHPQWAGRARRRGFWVALGVSIVLAASTLPNRGLNHQFGDLQKAYAYARSGNVMISADEQRMLAKLPELVEPDAVIANNPLNGSGLIYALADRQVLNYYMFQRLTPDQEYLNLHFNQASTDQRVCGLIRDRRIGYFLQMAPRMIGDYEYREDYGGLEVYRFTPGFESVAVIGRTALYRVTACG